MKINRRGFFALLLTPFLKKPAKSVVEILTARIQSACVEFRHQSWGIGGTLEGVDYDLCPDWDGSKYPTYGSIPRFSPLLPPDENDEDVLTRVTKKYLAADEEFQKRLDQAARDYFNPSLIYRLGNKD